jgi:hypothetical protein
MSLSRGREGHSSITAEIPAAAARPQPSRRDGITEGLAGRFTGSTKVSMAAVPPATK